MKNGVLWTALCLWLSLPYYIYGTTDVMLLQPVEPDSVQIDDFFWSKLQDSVRKYFPEIQKAPFRPIVDAEELVNLQRQWQEVLPQVSLTGSYRGQTDCMEKLDAALNLLQLSGRLAMATGESKYMDMVERGLYNEVAGAMRDDNKTESLRKAAPEIMAMPQWTYATTGTHIYVNFIMRSEVHIKTDSLDLRLSLVGSIPWYNKYMIIVEMDKPMQHFTLHVRIPSWLTGKNILPGLQSWTNRRTYSLTVNGEMPEKQMENGYLVVERDWKHRDFLHFTLVDNVLRLNYRDNPSLLALQRGPLVYAFDQLAQEDSAWLRSQAPVNNRFDKEKACVELKVRTYNSQGVETDTITAIPYIWNRRKLGEKIFVRQLEK